MALLAELLDPFQFQLPPLCCQPPSSPPTLEWSSGTSRSANAILSARRGCLFLGTVMCSARVQSQKHLGRSTFPGLVLWVLTHGPQPCFPKESMGIVPWEKRFPQQRYRPTVCIGVVILVNPSVFLGIHCAGRHVFLESSSRILGAGCVEANSRPFFRTQPDVWDRSDRRGA